MGTPITQVDAFTDRPFRGNPAAVCVLAEAPSDKWMQYVAREMNLSETAFLVPQGDGFHLRWFTPTTEVDLCGHATLASAHVLWSENHLAPHEDAVFYTKSGVLSAHKSGKWIELDFPVATQHPIAMPEEIGQALHIPPAPAYTNANGYLLLELADEEMVRDIAPDFPLLKQAPFHGVIVTSRTEGDTSDFVSRFFAPAMGINEDPVTGSAHCCLAPFWRDRLGKDEMVGYQASARGGIVKVRYDGGDRVGLAGQAVTVMKGELI